MTMTEKNEMRSGVEQLTDELLDQISGGTGSDDQETATMMLCKDAGCKFSHTPYWWKGDYVNDVMYQCPKCGQMTYYGVKHAFE